jgi:TPR repeat protein
MRALIALMLFAATPVVAGDYEDGTAAYDSGGYQKAFRLWKPLAERAEKNAAVDDMICNMSDCGDVRAQLTLGIMYRNGQVVPQDDAKAAYWFTKAAKHSPCGPQHIWVKPSVKVLKADQLKRQNCVRRRAEAQTHLGLMYANGEGVPEDDAMAVYWFKKAVVYSNAQAQNNRGLMYDKGEGVQQSTAGNVAPVGLDGPDDLRRWANRCRL